MGPAGAGRSRRKRGKGPEGGRGFGPGRGGGGAESHSTAEPRAPRRPRTSIAELRDPQHRPTQAPGCTCSLSAEPLARAPETPADVGDAPPHGGRRRAPGALSTRKPASGPDAATQRLCGPLPNGAARPAPAPPPTPAPRPRPPRAPPRFLNHGDRLLAETQTARDQGGNKAEEKGNQPRTRRKHGGRKRRPRPPTPPQPSGARLALASCPRTRPGAATSGPSPEQRARTPASQAAPPVTQNTEHPPWSTAPALAAGHPSAQRASLQVTRRGQGHQRGGPGSRDLEKQQRPVPRGRASPKAGLAGHRCMILKPETVSRSSKCKPSVCALQFPVCKRRPSPRSPSKLPGTGYMLR